MNTETTEFDEEKEYATREMECDQCYKQWIAVCRMGTERLQCPKCGYMVQVI